MLLSAKSIKATIALNPAETAAIKVPDGVPRIPFVVNVAGRSISCVLNAKSLRKAVAAVAADPDGYAVVLQGRLDPHDVLDDAGISAQPRKRAE